MKVLALLLLCAYTVYAVPASTLQLVQAAQGVTDLKSAFHAEELIKNWGEFKKTYSKIYKTTDEEATRFKVFVTHSWKIEKHNAEEALDGRHGFEVGMNEFGDMTNEEFKQSHLGYKYQKTSSGITFLAPSFTANPPAVDWRPKGYVTGIKNQGQCGSCWAFSATGSLEGQHFKKSGKLVSLSEQNLVDCSGSEGNLGCDGGLMDYAFTYIKKNGGIDTEASYAYTAKDGSCKFKKANVGATCTGYVDVKSGSEADLETAVATQGPISVAIDASNWSFQMYKKGVYNEPACSSTQLDHGVLAVGYNVTVSADNKAGTKYWTVKNSWGTSWGQKGYIWMSKDKNNQCGIATASSYPTV